MDILEKQCTSCNEVKPLTEYYPRYHRPNQLDTICKGCKIKRLKERKMGRPKRESKSPIIDTPNGKARRCTSCDVVKTLKHFYPNKSAKEGYSTKCSECFRTTYRANQEEINRHALERYYKKIGKAIPERTNRYSTTIIDSTPPVAQTFDIERFNAKRAQWRAVFDERFDDIMRLLKTYDEDRPESRSIVLEFHANVRSKWKLKHKTTEKYEAHFRKYGSSGW
jgi:hypothetical protein